MGIKDVVAGNFKASRAALDKTQREVADSIGVALRVYQNWEGAVSVPEVTTFEVAAKYFGKSVGWFYDDHSAENPSSEDQLISFAKMVLESRGYITLTPQELQDRLASITVSLFSKGGAFSQYSAPVPPSSETQPLHLRKPEVPLPPGQVDPVAIAGATDLPWELLDSMASISRKKQGTYRGLHVEPMVRSATAAR